MNADDKRIDGLTLLDAPAPRTGFWVDLHDQLVASTVDPIDDTAEHLGAGVARTARPRRAWLAVSGVAAATIVLVVAGLVMIETLRNDTPEAFDPAQTASPDFTIDDPMAIDLDSWATSAPVSGVGPFTVFDLDQLPAGWTVSGAPSGAHRITDLDPTHYHWTAGVSTADGRLVYLSAFDTNDEQATSTDGTPVSVHGQPGLVNGDTVTWLDTAGALLTVFSPDATPDELADIANALTITTTDTMTDTLTGTLNEPGDDQPTDQAATAFARLSGSVDGIRWEVTSADDATTSLSLNVGGRVWSSGVSASRPVESSWDVTFSGLGERGVVLYGLAPADIANIRVRLDDTTIVLPVVHSTGVTIFAIPMPPGLHIRSVELINADGRVRHNGVPPRFVTPTLGTSVFYGLPFGTTSNESLAPTSPESP